MQTSLFRSILLVALVGGCAGDGQLTYSGTATVAAPELVVISPGVQVIADLDEPIFYSDNYYWRNEGGHWYRSTSHTRGWARVDVAPVAIRTIERPSAYIHYRAGAHARVDADRRVAPPAAPPAPAPVVRDHREAVAPAPRADDRHDNRDGNDKHDGKDKHDKRDGKDKHDRDDDHDRHDGHRE